MPGPDGTPDVRVLYLNPFSQAVSGPDESLLGLIGALRPLGVDPHVVLPKPGPHVARYEALGAKVHYAPLTVLKRSVSLQAIAAMPFSLFRGARAVAAIAREERIDLIHTNMEVVLDGSIASRLWRIPHLLHYRGNTLDQPKIVFDALTRFWTSTSFRVVAISDATAKIFRKRGLGEQVVSLPNPVDVGAYLRATRSDEVRRELGAEPGDILLGTVGRVHPRKDLETFLRAGALLTRSIPRLKIVVVGSAEAPEEVDYQRRLDGLVQDLGIADRVRFAGARRDMPAVFKALDLFVLASRHEGFGRVVAEAIAAGLPAVVSDEGAPPSLVGDPRRGARAGDPVDFAARTLAVHQRPEDFAFDAEKAAERFSPPLIAAIVFEIYEAAIAAARRR
jgi:glycosyltransferase involved in cell wall biosynthesis